MSIYSWHGVPLAYIMGIEGLFFRWRAWCEAIHSRYYTRFATRIAALAKA